MAEGPSNSEIETNLKIMLRINSDQSCQKSADKVHHQSVYMAADQASHDLARSHKKKKNLQYGELEEHRTNSKWRQKDYRQSCQPDCYPAEQQSPLQQQQQQPPPQPLSHVLRGKSREPPHSWKESRKEAILKSPSFAVNNERKISILKAKHGDGRWEKDHGKSEDKRPGDNNSNAQDLCPMVLEMMNAASADLYHTAKANDSVNQKLEEELAKEDKVFPLKRRSLKYPGAKYFCRLCEYHCMNDADCRSHIRTEKHQWRKEIAAAEAKLKKLPKATIGHLRAIEKALDHIYHNHGLTMEETRQRQKFVKEVEVYLQEDLKGLRLHLYGSSITGFGLKSSDLNVDLETPNGMNLANGLKVAYESLKKSEKYKDVRSDFLAKVPSVYFCSSTNDQLFCRITVNSLLAQQTSQLLAVYGGIDSRARKLAVALRYWAKICCVDRQEEGTLPAYCTVLMTVYFLQRCQPAVLPVFSIGSNEEEHTERFFENIRKGVTNFSSGNKLNIGELWLELLKFYCQGFDSSRTVISIKHDGKLTRVAKNWRTKRLAIEDPFSTKRNIARSVSGRKIFEYFQDCLVKTCLYFGFPPTLVSCSTTNSVKADCEQENKGSPTAETDPKPDSSSNKSPRCIAQTPNSSVKTNSAKVCDGNQNGQLESINDFHDPSTVGCKDSPAASPATQGQATCRAGQGDTSPIEAALNECVLTDRTDSSRCKNVPCQKSSVNDEGAAYVFSVANLSDGKGPAIICSICEKEGHLKNNCPEERLPPLLPLPAMTKESLLLLNDTLLQIPKDLGPKEWSTDDREKIVKGLEGLIRERYPEARLHLFGSSCNGFGFQNSDLDICITFGNHQNADGLDCVSIIESLSQKLRENKQLYGVVAITTAKVPIVKFKLKNSNLEGDISLYNTLAQHNTKLLKLYTQIDNRVAILGYALKVFAKVCEIGDASKGSLSSYAYILMLLHYLQQCDPPVIPVLQELYEGEKPVHMVDGWNAWFFEDLENLKNSWKYYGQNKLSVAELWIGLFVFYTEKFDLQMVVTIRQHSPLTRFEKLWNGKCLAIEDPFDVSHNLGVGLSRKMNNYIMKTFINGRNVYGTPVTQIPSNYETPGDYFFDATRLKEGKPPTDRCCRACGKIGHIVKDCHLTKSKRNKDVDNKQDRHQKKKDNDIKFDRLNSPARENQGNQHQKQSRSSPVVPNSAYDEHRPPLYHLYASSKNYNNSYINWPAEKHLVQQSTSTTVVSSHLQPISSMVPSSHTCHPVSRPERAITMLKPASINNNPPMFHHLHGMQLHNPHPYQNHPMYLSVRQDQNRRNYPSDDLQVPAQNLYMRGSHSRHQYSSH